MAAFSSAISSSALASTGPRLGQSKPTSAARFCSLTARVRAGSASGTSSSREEGAAAPRSAFSSALIRCHISSGKKLIAACVAEHMRVPPDHLAGDRIDHIGEFEALQLRGHLRVVNDLKQQVAKLVLQRLEIVARDRLGDLVGFLDRIGRDGREGLLGVPRTARVLVAQARHDGEQVGERVALVAGCVSHGARQGQARQASALKANSFGPPRG